ncbi:MAG: DNA polymerase III subunit delta [Verrucomicrobiota bacterium]
MTAKSQSSNPVVLVCGDDEFGVKQRARAIYQNWCGQGASLDHEIIDAGASNSSDALDALAKLQEALQTLPFFGGGKVVWFQNCTFLGDERAASTQAVTERLSGLAQELKAFPWGDVKLLISAGKVDKRKVFYKALEKLGTIETFSGWSADDRDWASAAEESARQQLKALKKTISWEALAKLVAGVGPNSRQLSSETEKLAIYVGTREQVEVADVEAVTVRNKQGRAFALGEALGERNLPKLLKTLDEELWEMKRDSQKSEIGLLYGIISKVRTMIFLKEMLREGWIKGESDYNRFKMQLERVPSQALPEDRRFNPLAMNAYVLFKTLGHVKHYTLTELTRAMDLLLSCNQALVLSRLDEATVLQQTLVKIISRTTEEPLT